MSHAEGLTRRRAIRGGALLGAGVVAAPAAAQAREAANEAARRAVNAVLERSRSRPEPCRIYERYRPPEFEQLKRVDQQRYERGEPNAFEVGGPPRALPLAPDIGASGSA